MGRAGAEPRGALGVIWLRRLPVCARPASAACAGFCVLALSELGAAAASVAMVLKPSGLPSTWPRSGNSDVLVRAWGLTWLALSVVLLAVLVTSVAQRWARLVLVSVPGVWLAHFLLAPGTVHNLLLALVTAAALAATFRSAPRGGRTGGGAGPQ